MRKNLGTTLGWIALTLMLCANVAFAKEVAAAPSSYWTCGMIVGPGPGSPGEYVCIDFLYDQCDCPYCVIGCMGGD